jgi:hypothetical protein
MQNMQNMHINMHKYVNEYAVICNNMPNNMQNNSSLSIFCILCILLYAEYAEYAVICNWHILHIEHISAYSNILIFIFSCIFLHIFFIEFSKKARNRKPKHRVYKPWEQVHCCKTRFLPGPHQTGHIISCRFEYDHTIIVTCKWKRKVMICIICIICTKIMNMHNMHMIYKYRVRYLNLQEVCQARTKPHQ